MSARSTRRGFVLLEVLVAGVLLLIASLIVMQLLGTNTNLTAWNRDALLARERARTVAAYWRSFAFPALENRFSGEAPTDEEMAAMLLPLDGVSVDPRALGIGEYQERQRFTRLMGLGILQTQLAWRSHRGGVRRQDHQSLVIDDTMFVPLDLPSTGAELVALASRSAPADESRRGLQENKEWGTARRAGSGHARARSPRARTAGGATTAQVRGAGLTPPQQAGSAGSAAARASADQLMEMLHELNHADDESVQVQGLVRRLRALLGETEDEEGTPDESDRSSYNWARLQGYGSSKWRTGASPRVGTREVVEVLAEREIPDGDYLYTYQLETESADESEGQLLVVYRLVSLEDKKIYLLPKTVDQDGVSRKVQLEAREVLDLGDRTLAFVEPVGAKRRLLAEDEWAHLETTTKRLYAYRARYSSQGVAESFDSVLSIRSFPAELVGDGDGPVSGRELDRALDPLLTALGLGSDGVDAREHGVDTKQRLGW